jgi:BON domain
MRTRYEPPRRRPRREHFEPSAAQDREQDDRDAYGEYPGQSGDDYDDAERRFGVQRRRGAPPYQRVPTRDRWEQSDFQEPEASPHAYVERQDGAHGFRGQGPRGYTRSDERIREEICELLTDEDVDVSDVEVQVSNGEATLTGTVRDRRTKREVESVVDGVSGVNDVSNQLRIQGAQGAQGASKDPLSSLGRERRPDDRQEQMPGDQQEQMPDDRQERMP